MNVKEYRDLTADLFKASTDLHACVDANERAYWLAIASVVYEKAIAAECERATIADTNRMNLAQQEFLSSRKMAEDRKKETISPTATINSKKTRAGSYNKSPSRAVRLSRAARSAMRRGYF